MPLRITIKRVECIEESDDGPGSDEFLALIAIMPIDTSPIGPPQYAAGRRSTFAFYHDDFDSGESFELDHLKNSSEEIGWVAGRWVEIIVVLREIDGDDSEQAIEAIRTSWANEINDSFKPGTEQGGPRTLPSGDVVHYEAAVGRAVESEGRGEDETLGFDIFHMTFSDDPPAPSEEPRPIGVRPPSDAIADLYARDDGAVDMADFMATASRGTGDIIGPVETTTESVGDFLLLETRRYRSNRNDSTYEVDFEFRVVG